MATNPEERDELPLPTLRTDDRAEPEARRTAPKKTLKQKYDENETTITALVYAMMLVVIGLMLWNNQYLMGGFTAVGLVLVYLIVKVDSTWWGGWGKAFEQFGAVLLLLLGVVMGLLIAAQKESEKAKAVGEVTTQVEALKGQVPAPDQEVVKKGTVEDLQKRLLAADAALKGAPATPTTGSDLKLTPAIMAQIQRPDAKKLILPKQNGANWVLTAKRGQPGGMLVPPGTAGIVIEEKGMEVHVTSTTDIENTNLLYLTDGKRAGNSELLPPVK
jgi:hypothetical protein